MTHVIERHFVTLEGEWGPRQVHYRRSGSGPPLLLLHQSPKSSREYEPLMRHWAEHFTVIAPDTPGFGQSDPLPVERTTLQGLAGCVIEFADAIGLDVFSVYGFHTGGGMALALADAVPDRVCAVAANGLVMPTPEERADILEHYLPAFRPEWDGSHLAWVWARMREQTVFFPWHARTLSNRMVYTVPGPQALQENVREFLQAGDHYRVGYRAAFEYDASPTLARLAVPALVTAAQQDPLAPHLDRVERLAPSVQVQVSGNGEAAVARALALLREHARGEAPPPPAAQAVAGRAWQDSVQLESGPVRLLRTGRACQALVLHGAAGSALTAGRLLHGLGEAAAMDLPGHGEHAWNAEGRPGVVECARRVIEVLSELGGEPPLLAGEGEGGWVALEAARMAPERCSGVLLLNPPVDLDGWREDILREGLPSMEPDWHGGHLSRAWHCVRDGRLFHPWFRRTPEAIRWIEPDLDPLRLTLEVRELLSAEGCWQHLVRDALDYPAKERAASLPAPLFVAASADSPVIELAENWARELPGAGFSALPGDSTEWPDLLRALNR